MIEVAIPKDVMSVQTTTVGAFTSRQIICSAISAAVAYGAYRIVAILDIPITLNSLVGLGCVLVLPIMAFAVLRPYGLPLEKFLKNAFVLGFLAPKIRPYVIENISFKDETGVDEKNTKKNKTRQFSNSELKLHPDYIEYL